MATDVLLMPSAFSPIGGEGTSRKESEVHSIGTINNSHAPVIAFQKKIIQEN